MNNYRNKNPLHHSKGFTLIELTLIIAILAILASIAIPKLGDMITAAKEASVKGKLGILRSAINIYYANSEGMYPTYIETSLPGIYIDSIPPLHIPPVRKFNNPGHFSDIVIETDEPIVDDTGAWVYFTNDNSIDLGVQRIRMGKGKKIGWDKREELSKIKYLELTPMGRIYIDCFHLDLKGRIWSTH